MEQCVLEMPNVQVEVRSWQTLYEWNLIDRNTFWIWSGDQNDLFEKLWLKADRLTDIQGSWLVLAPTGMAKMDWSKAKGCLGRFERSLTQDEISLKRILHSVLRAVFTRIRTANRAKEYEASGIQAAAHEFKKEPVSIQSPHQSTPPEAMRAGSRVGAFALNSKPILPDAEKALRKFKPRAICIAVSTGGPNALNVMLPELCKVTTLPILIVQHMPAAFTGQFANSLNQICQHEVVEAQEGMLIAEKTVYIAPGGKHMVFVKDQVGRGMVHLNMDPPLHNCRPAADAMLPTAGDLYGGDLVVIVLTGMGADGSLSLDQLKRKGAIIIAQDEESSVVWGMPGMAVATGNVDRVLPLMKIPQQVQQILSPI